MIGVLSPLYRLRKGLAKTYKLNATGYAKLYGVKSSMDGQLRIPMRCGEISPFLYGRSMEYIRYFASKIGVMIQDKDFEQLIQYFNEHNIDPLTLIEELLKIKTINVEDADPQCFGVNLNDVWKTNVKRDFTKEFCKRKPKTQGVKFSDAPEKPERKKIKFFEKFL